MRGADTSTCATMSSSVVRVTELVDVKLHVLAANEAGAGNDALCKLFLGLSCVDAAAGPGT